MSSQIVFIIPVCPGNVVASRAGFEQKQTKATKRFVCFVAFCSQQHVFHPEAVEEYAAVVEVYRAIDLALGVRFYDEIERVISGNPAALARGVMRDPL